MADNKEHWIPARTRYNQEVCLRKFFTDNGITYFVPFRRVVRKFGDNVREVEMPLIPNLVFLKVNWDEAFRLLRVCQNKMFYIRQKDRMIMTVPDKQMDDFIRLVTETEGKVTINPDGYVVGDRVVIRSGNLAGIEGILVDTGGKKEFVLQIDALFSARVRIPQSNLIKIKDTDAIR